MIAFQLEDRQRKGTEKNKRAQSLIEKVKTRMMKKELSSVNTEQMTTGGSHGLGSFFIKWSRASRQLLMKR